MLKKFVVISRENMNMKKNTSSMVLEHFLTLIPI